MLGRARTETNTWFERDHKPIFMYLEVKMFFCGMDMGHQALKIAFGEVGGPCTTRILPAGSGPVDLLDIEPSVEAAAPASCRVWINGEAWVSGIEPDLLQPWERPLHTGYPATESYLANFYAALLCCGSPVIDVLVVGLPVFQMTDPALAESLRTRLLGEHQFAPGQRTVVQRVVVLPHPAGAYLEMIQGQAERSLLEQVTQDRAVVIDVGFFSVDWLVMELGTIKYALSGSSLISMSVLLEQCNDRIIADHGIGPRVDSLERAYRCGRRNVLLSGKKIHIRRYIDQSSRAIAGAAMAELKKSMPEAGVATDVVLLTGGGVEAYRREVEGVFGNAEVLVPENPVTANARGFWNCGNSLGGL